MEQAQDAEQPHDQRCAKAASGHQKTTGNDQRQGNHQLDRRQSDIHQNQRAAAQHASKIAQRCGQKTPGQRSRDTDCNDEEQVIKAQKRVTNT